MEELGLKPRVEELGLKPRAELLGLKPRCFDGGFCAALEVMLPTLCFPPLRMVFFCMQPLTPHLRSEPPVGLDWDPLIPLLKIRASRRNGLGPLDSPV